jgi:prepilin-type N-terminal cleavage/methylation domain-containing protein
MNKFKKIFLKGKKSGFTLIELLIVIAVIAILTSIVFVALNPLGRFQDARNSTRWTDVNGILSAIKLYQVDNNGSYIQTINDMTPDLYYAIGTSDLPSCNDECLNPEIHLEATCVNLTQLSDRGYLPAIPFDPYDRNASTEESRYFIKKDALGRITIGACQEEAGSNNSAPTIEVTR